MAVKLAKDALDLGVTTVDFEAMTRFYRDVLEFELVGEFPTRASPDGLVREFRCGASIIKLLSYGTRETSEPQRVRGLRVPGYRYWIMRVNNIEEIIARCEGFGFPMMAPLKEIAAGIRVALVEDPDGNWIEFMEER